MTKWAKRGKLHCLKNRFCNKAFRRNVKQRGHIRCFFRPFTNTRTSRKIPFTVTNGTVSVNGGSAVTSGTAGPGDTFVLTAILPPLAGINIQVGDVVYTNCIPIGCEGNDPYDLTVEIDYKRDETVSDYCSTIAKLPDKLL